MSIEAAQKSGEFPAFKNTVMGGTNMWKGHKDTDMETVPTDKLSNQEFPTKMDRSKS